MPKDLSGFLTFLQEQYPSNLEQVSRPIKPAEFEVTALLEHLDQEKLYPAVLFNNPANVHGELSGIKLVSNIFATRELCALALGMNPSEAKMPLSLEYARRENLSIPPEIIKSALSIVDGILAVFALAIAAENYFRRPLKVVDRILYLVTCFAFFVPGWESRVIGIILLASLLGYSYYRTSIAESANVSLN